MIAIKEISFVFLVMLLLTNPTSADSGTAGYTPDSWWPSEWDADDELGALNRLDNKKVLQAAALIKNGVIYDMTRIYSEDMPLFNLTPGARKFASRCFRAGLSRARSLS